MQPNVIEKVGLFGSGILAGLFLCSCLVEHAARRLDGPHWLAYKQAKEKVFGPVMPVIFGAVLVFQCSLAVITSRHQGYGITVALLLSALAITVTVHLPLNRRFEGWSGGSLPALWHAERQRWRVWNWVRCAPAVGAFVISLALLAS